MIRLFLLLLFFPSLSYTQVNPMSEMSLPYHSIPEYPETFSAATVSARMLDGLGFRYRWATEGLRQEDLDYRIDSTARTSHETLLHIHSLSRTIRNSTEGKVNIRPEEKVDLGWTELRRETLENIKATADLLKTMSHDDLSGLEISFQRGEKRHDFPYWHNYNGPIADALWHVGQVVSFRRASGNPIDFRVNVFSGKLRER